MLALALAAILFSAASETRAGAIPLAAVDQPKVLWRIVMEGFYGPYDKRQKCWIAHMGGETVCMRPHRLDQVSIQGVNHYYLVIGGTRLDESGQPQGSHADAGVLGLMIFKDDGKFLKLVARNDLHSSMGSFGSIPDEDQFAVREIGPNDSYGWVANNGWMGQGIMISYSDVFAAVGDTVVDIGTLPAHYDNSGNCEDDKVIGSGEPCSDYSSTVMFDSAQRNDRFYPVILKVTGSREGVAIDRTYSAKFDPNKLTYSKIEGLPKEFANGI
jgi:hypothetical protein